MGVSHPVTCLKDKGWAVLKSYRKGMLPNRREAQKSTVSPPASASEVARHRSLVSSHCLYPQCMPFPDKALELPMEGDKAPAHGALLRVSGRGGHRYGPKQH